MIGMICYMHLFVLVVLSWIGQWLVMEISAKHLFAFFLESGFLFYFVHRLGHERRFSVIWYKAHTNGHHYLAYPPSQPDRAEYFYNSIDKSRLNTWSYVLAGLCNMTLAFQCAFLPFSCPLLAFLILTQLFMLGIENYFHHQFHLNQSKSCFAQTSWFQYLKAVHMKHHRVLNVNFAVVALWTDVVMQTFDD